MTPPELAVVVLSHGDPAGAIAAAASLLAQEPPVEVIVSHSGGPADGLADRLPGATFAVSGPLRLPGAARNAGVAAARAPFVAFLAADCRADAGWAAARLARHRAGAVAVGSALAPLDGGLVSLASHVLQHSGRAAHVTAPPAYRFGASYSREALAAHGPFPEDIEFAEDMVVNLRLLAAGIEIEPAPDVLTRHAYPGSMGALCRDQYRRARRRAAVRGRPRWRLSLLGRSLAAAPVGLWRMAAPGTNVPRLHLIAALPLVALGALCGAAGSLRSAPPTRAAETERRLHDWLRAWRRTPPVSG